MDTIRRWLTYLGVLTGRPWAFFSVPIYGALWIAVERQSFGFHAIAILATWFMTLVIQRAEQRDFLALHAKLDELIRTQEQATDAVAFIDEKEPEDIAQHRHDSRVNR